MNIVIGKIVNTFGIKGELKIVSNFEMANRAFKKGNKISYRFLNCIKWSL